MTSPLHWLNSLNFIIIDWYPWIKKRVNYFSCMEGKGYYRHLLYFIILRGNSYSIMRILLYFYSSPYHISFLYIFSSILFPYCAVLFTTLLSLPLFIFRSLFSFFIFKYCLQKFFTFIWWKLLCYKSSMDFTKEILH